MSGFTLPTKRKQPDLNALRRTLITAMWVDYKLFGYTTESVWALQKRIVKAKSHPEPVLSVVEGFIEGQAQKVIQFPNGNETKKAA